MVKVQRNSPSILFIQLEGREGMEEKEGCRGEGQERRELHQNWVSVMSKFTVFPPHCPSFDEVTLANNYTRRRHC